MSTSPDKGNNNKNAPVFQDKTLWVIGITTAIILIIIKLLLFFPKHISDTAPFILTDLAMLIEKLRGFVERFNIWTIAYIAMLAVFSKYLQDMKLHGVRKAIFLIMAATALLLILQLYKNTTGPYDCGGKISVNAIISGICQIASTGAIMYIAAVLLNYKGYRAQWLDKLAIVLIIIIGIPVLDFIPIIMFFVLSWTESNLNYIIDDFEISSYIFKASTTARLVFSVLEYYIFYRIFLDAKKSLDHNPEASKNGHLPS